MSLKIKVFQVGCGDSISISYAGHDNSDYNIFIDGGYIKSYLRTLSPEINQINKVNLWIATHIDRDHINGFIAFLKDTNFSHKDKLEKVWFNTPDRVEFTSNSDKAGFQEGFWLKNKLLELKIPIDDNISIETTKRDIGGAKITILSPDVLSLDNFKLAGQEERDKYSEPAGNKEDDYQAKIEDLDQISDEKEDEKDLSNRSSIAFLFEYRETDNSYRENKVLFLGDAHASIIVKGLEKRNRELGLPETNRLKVDYVKLAHHGSKCNFSNQLLDMIDCDNFIISANGGGTYNLPNKEVLAKILCHPKRNLDNQITFIFNHDNDILRNIFVIDDNAEVKYNFRCQFPENGQNAFIIHF